MKARDKRRFETLIRVTVFEKNEPHLFGEGTIASNAMAVIKAAVAKLAGHDESLEGGHAVVKQSKGDKAAARAELRDCLGAMYRTVRMLKLPQFFKPQGRSDRTLLAVADLWMKQADPHRQSFIEAGLPGIIERVKAAADRIQLASNDASTGVGVRKTAASGIDQTLAEAFAALERLDPVMENMLSGTPTLAYWRQARHVERRSVVRSAVTGDQNASTGEQSSGNP